MSIREKHSNQLRDYPVVTLSDKLLEGLREVAVLRAKHGNRISVDEEHEITDNHFIGLCGEAAVAGYYSLPLNLTYHHPIDPGYDFIVKHTPQNKRLRIDVKTRINLNSNLLITKSKIDNDADIYILCLKKNSKIILRGSVSTEIIEKGELIKIDRDLAYSIPQNQLYELPLQNHITSTDIDMEGLSSVKVDTGDLVTIKDNQ